MDLRKAALAASLLAGCLLAPEAFAQYAPVGVQQNVPEATVTAGGWTTCYSENFTHYGTSLATVQADCDKASLMLACRQVGSPNFTLLAQAPREDVLFDTGTGNTPHNANGVGWYYNDSYSWGFAPEGEALYRGSCDYYGGGAQTVPELRMCVHTESGLISDGYRCGDDTTHDFYDGQWERVVLESDGGITGPTAGVFIGDAGDNEPVVVAEEVVVPPARTITNAGNALDVVTNVGYAFSPGEVRYARLECPGIAFGANTTVAYFGDASNAIGAVNGIGSDAIFFSITAGANPVMAHDQLAIGGDRDIESKQATDCTYGLYDFPSEAQTGGATGRVATASGGYLRFAPSYALSVNSQGLATADVESADPPFSAFTDDAPTGSPAVGQLGGFSVGTAEDVSGGTQPIGLDGMPVELEDLLDDDTALVFGGDFSAAGAVYMASSADCGGLTLPADSFDDAGATFTIGAQGGAAFLCYAAGDEAIPAGDYTVSLDAVPVDPATYATDDIAAQAIGSIVHNGTQLQAPLANVPTGWISRMILTNTGGRDRAYQISVMGETGNTIGSANLTGVVPANGTKVVDLDTVMTSFSGKARGTVNVTVAAPNNQIQGLLQIVSDSGAISNETMVRPGSN